MYFYSAIVLNEVCYKCCKNVNSINTSLVHGSGVNDSLDTKTVDYSQSTAQLQVESPFPKHSQPILSLQVGRFQS